MKNHECLLFFRSCTPLKYIGGIIKVIQMRCATDAGNEMTI